jgi:hypothetical protein
MSVTLRYSGSLSHPDLLPRLKEDFLDIAATHAWPVDELSVPKPEAAEKRGRGLRTLAPPQLVQGLKIYVHPQTDPLWLTFDPEGVLTRIGGFPPAAGGYGSPKAAFLHQSQASMQTGIGGWQLHAVVVSLLDYLNKAYVPGLQVSDETGYWEKRDLDGLKRLMAAS